MRKEKSGYNKADWARTRRGAEAQENSRGWAHLTGEVFDYMRCGMVPHEIDDRMCLPEGMAREIVVAHWSKHWRDK